MPRSIKAEEIHTDSDQFGELFLSQFAFCSESLQPDSKLLPE
jgi:hypothetical protein